MVLHGALLHLLTISSLLDDHAADTTVSGCAASSTVCLIEVKVAVLCAFQYMP